MIISFTLTVVTVTILSPRWRQTEPLKVILVRRSTAIPVRLLARESLFNLRGRRHISTLATGSSFGFNWIEDSQDDLHCDHLICDHRIGNALVVLTALERKLLLIPLLLLLDQAFDILLSMHLLTVVEVRHILWKACHFTLLGPLS